MRLLFAGLGVFALMVVVGGWRMLSGATPSDGESPLVVRAGAAPASVVTNAPTSLALSPQSLLFPDLSPNLAAASRSGCEAERASPRQDLAGAAASNNQRSALSEKRPAKQDSMRAKHSNPEYMPSGL
jgi:hypothetical protein